MLRQYDFITGPETDDLPNSGVINSQLVATKNGSYTVLDDDAIGTIIVTATGTITFPAPANNIDRILEVISEVDANLTINVTGGGTINGVTSITLTRKYQRLKAQCDGSEYFLISEYPEALIQDFTQIKDVGDANQQKAGHIYISDLLGVGSDIAYYKFANGAMTTDEEGTHTLSAGGSPANANGITGSDFAASFGGGDYYTQATLLDSPSTLTNGIGISLWLKADDGQPAAEQRIVVKNNDETGGSLDYLFLELNTNGSLQFSTGSSGTTVDLNSVTNLPNGATEWVHVALNWSSEGQKLFINGVLEAQDTTATTLMSDGTARDFIIGANNFGGSIANQFTGDIALLQVHDIKYTQKDIDKLLSVRYTHPALFGSSVEYKLRGEIQALGDTSYRQEVTPRVIHKNSTYFYLAGHQFDQDDKIKLKAKG